MDLDILKPEHAVQKAFFEPNMALAAILVLLPTIVSAIGAIIIGLQLNITLTVLSAIIGIAGWIITGIIIYFIGYLASAGHSLKGKLNGVLSAMALVWLVFSVISIAGFVFAIATIPQEVILTVNDLQNGKIAETAAVEKIFSIVDKAPEPNMIILAVFAIISIILVLFSVYMVFLIAKEIKQKGFLTQAIMTILFIAAWIIVSGLLGTITTRFI